MTWKEISWPQRSEANTETPAPQHVNPPVIEDHDEGTLMRPVSTAISSDEHALGLNGLPSTGEDFMPDIDSYLQMADEFSSYLTWDPWNFGIS